VLLAASALLATACASAPAPPPPPSAVFFPAPPELPRVQYLTSFSGRKDVESQSGFNRFVVGEQADIRLDKPYGVAIHRGRIYVCDTNATVVVFDLERRSFELLAGATGEGQLLAPVNVTIDAQGNKYVADPARGQVVVFGPDDRFLRAYGTPGGWRPVDAVAYQGLLYVADGANASVRVFALDDGEEVATIGNRGEAAERLDRPTNLAFDSAGRLYVSDVGRFQVVVYDRDGHHLRTVGTLGDNLGHFARPKGIALDREDRLLAVDAAFNNVQMFDPEGRLLMFFGRAGSAGGDLQLPAKVTIDYDNLDYFRRYAAPGFELEYVALVTSQFGDRMISVFGYGRQKGRTYPSEAELARQIEERRREAQERLREPAPAAEPVAPPSPAATEQTPDPPPPEAPPAAPPS
jgi:sugar lactone lactonase YvrE